MKQNRFTIIAIAIVLVVAGTVVAQQRGAGPRTPPTGAPSTIVGTVVSFTASAGTGMPALVVRGSSTDVTLVLGPYWFLQDAKFEAAAGDLVEVAVIGCTDCPSGYAVVSVNNLTKGLTVTLRNADGTPLWITGGQGGRGGNGHAARRGRGNGPGSFGNCAGQGPDMTKVATWSGTVKSFEGGAGAGRPTLVLATTEGDKTFIVAPYRAVADSGLTFVAGAAITLTAAPTVNGEWVVVTLKDAATGAELVLRDATTGAPIGGRGRGMGNGSCRG